MKTRLFRTVVAFLFAGLALTQVGCDYGQQIDDLNNRIDELTTGKIASIESQYSSLQTTLAALQAKDATMETKSAELQTAINTLQSSLSGFLTKDQLNATLTSYATVEQLAKLGDLATEEAIRAAIAAAGEALEASFKTAFDAVAAGEAATGELAKSIAAAYEAAQAKTIAAIEEAILKNGSELNKAVLDAINAELAKYISARLTSLQVIPTLFVDGVETVELESFKYNATTVTSDDKTETVVVDKSKEFTTSSLAATVQYYVSPAQVTTEDIVAEDVEFVCEQAETRAAADVPVEVAAASIKGGKLSVSLVRTAANADVNLDGRMTWIGAVKVPIADKHLTAEEKDQDVDVAVISDFVALKESSVQPIIASLIDHNENGKVQGKFDCKWSFNNRGHNHFQETYAAAQAQRKASNAAKYSEPLNLTAMVTGCNNYTASLQAGFAPKELTKETLKAAGLEFRFAAPTKPYEVGDNEADQQQFITVYEKDGVWYAKSKLPNGVVDNQAAVGKTPIVRVELVDVNNKNAVVDARYFKVEWTPEVPVAMEVVDLGEYKFEYTLSCANFEEAVLWKDMINDILANFGDNGISFEDFIKYYTAAASDITSEVDEDGEYVAAKNTGTIELNNDGKNKPEAPALTWTITTAEIGKVMNEDGTLIADKAVKTAWVKFTPKNVYTHRTYLIKFVLDVKLPAMPVMNGYRSALWSDDGVLAKVFPVQYKPEFATTEAVETCSYNYDFAQLFTNNQLVKNLLPCGTWAYVWTDDAKKIVANAVNLQHQDVYFGVVEPTTKGATNVAKPIEAYVSLKENNNVPTAEAKAILGKNAALNVMAKINAYNPYKVSTFELNFVEPLKVNTTLVEGNFVDKVVSGSVVDCSKAFGLTDFVGYLVAEKTTNTTDEKKKYAADLWKYYGVTATQWDLDKAVINIVKDKDGNEVVDDTLTAETAKMTAKDYFGEGCLTKNGSELIFKNVRGADVAKVCKVYIPVTVSHKWGTTSAKVAIEIHPAF